MPFFILPQRWITPAIIAASMHFGSIDQSVQVKYFNFPKVQYGGAAQPPNVIYLDKAKRWDKRQAQCLLIHEFGHLRGKRHSKNPNSIMRPNQPYDACVRWLKRHHVR